MKTGLHDYFYFSKTQRNGFIIVMSLIFLTFFLSNTLSNYLAKPATDFSVFKEEVMAFEAETKILDKNDFGKNSSKEVLKEMNTPITLFSFDPNIVTKEALIKLGIKSTVANTFIKYRNTGAKFYKKQDIKKVYGITDSDYSRLAPYIQFNQRLSANKEKEQPKFIKQPVPKTLTPFAFNPNDATKQTLLALGLSEKVSQTIINFRSKGGQFWKKQDFKKIYGLTPKDYLTLAPYIEISPSKTSIAEKKHIPSDVPQSLSTTTAIKIDINNSNIEDWKKLKGIGNITAQRIINFRDKLGGFISVEQIKMIYNVPDSVIEKVATQLVVSPIPHKILINTISADALKVHPYIKRKQAHAIINYRSNHGYYQRIDDLHKVKSLNQAFIERLQPYLSFNDLEVAND